MAMNGPTTGASDERNARFRRARLIGRILAASLVAVVAWNWILVEILLRNAPWSLLGLVLIPFFALLIGSVVGLLRVRPWGFYCAYLLVPVSTILHGIPLVPFITDWLPSQGLRIGSVLVLNVAVLVATAAGHLMYRRSRPADGAGDATVGAT